MSRYAVWRCRPEDPKQALGWILWGDRHLSAHRRPIVRGLIAGAIAVCGAMGYAGVGAFLILIVAILWMALALYARPGAREHAELPMLGGADAFPVTVEILRGLLRIGRENGWVAFADGWLVYEGLRTSFAIRASDVRIVRGWSGRVSYRLPSGTRLTISLLTDFMQTNRPGGWRMGRRLRDEMEAWRNASPPAGEAVYPPPEVSPRVWGERTNTLGALSALSLLFMWIWWRVGALPWVAVTVLLSMGFAFGACLSLTGLQRALGKVDQATSLDTRVGPLP